MNTENKLVFESWYREYFQGIYRYAYRFVGNGQDAEQLAQETFANLYSHFSSDGRVINPKALIYRIATNTCLNFLKRGKKWEAIVAHGFIAPSLSASGQEDRLIKEQQIALIKRSLLDLPLRDRQCLLLYQEGLSYSEIAEVANMKKSSVGKILARAFARLALEIGNGDKL